MGQQGFENYSPEILLFEFFINPKILVDILQMEKFRGISGKLLVTTPNEIRLLTFEAE